MITHLHLNAFGNRKITFLESWYSFPNKKENFEIFLLELNLYSITKTLFPLFLNSLWNFSVWLVFSLFILRCSCRTCTTGILCLWTSQGQRRWRLPGDSLLMDKGHPAVSLDSRSIAIQRIFSCMLLGIHQSLTLGSTEFMINL